MMRMKFNTFDKEVITNNGNDNVENENELSNSFFKKKDQKEKDDNVEYDNDVNKDDIQDIVFGKYGGRRHRKRVGRPAQVVPLKPVTVLLSNVMCLWQSVVFIGKYVASNIESDIFMVLFNRIEWRTTYHHSALFCGVVGSAHGILFFFFFPPIFYSNQAYFDVWSVFFSPQNIPNGEKNKKRFFQEEEEEEEEEASKQACKQKASCSKVKILHLF
ncbi:hypothetical protein RFI_01648 [Reticulomyxa filosa]|uniref:Uncharacterized protein n=1 Tax=Reticulomyxa filosa TaxID=46433 RepID=X6PBI9_RETFI|nr:hypothetical protein RFI_01648 [Reticulomyxa filosa]|eukprot:ETO35414.1 hypothetical protein RFI_01648 [Reticulomyxa filosa]